jgi:hypothetical protein
MPDRPIASACTDLGRVESIRVEPHSGDLFALARELGGRSSRLKLSRIRPDGEVLDLHDTLGKQFQSFDFFGGHVVVTTADSVYAYRLTATKTDADTPRGTVKRTSLELTTVANRVKLPAGAPMRIFSSPHLIAATATELWRIAVGRNQITVEQLLAGMPDRPGAILGFGGDPPFALIYPGFVVDLGRTVPIPRLHPARFYGPNDKPRTECLKAFDAIVDGRRRANLPSELAESQPVLDEVGRLEREGARLVGQKEALIERRVELEERYRALRERAVGLMGRLKALGTVTSDQQMLLRIAGRISASLGDSGDAQANT